MEETRIHGALMPEGVVPETLPNEPPLSTSKHNATTSIATAGGCGSVVREGELLKLGGKKKDKWQQVEVRVATDSGLSWSFGSRMRDTATGSQKSLTLEQIVRAAYYSEFGVDYAFEVISTAKGGKVYKFAAASDADRDLWIEAIEHVVRFAAASEQTFAPAQPQLQPQQPPPPQAAQDMQMVPTDAEGPSVVAVTPSTTRYRAIKRAWVRAGYARDSELIGALEPGTVIEVLESRTAEQRQQHVRFMYQSRHSETEGWTSVVSADGHVVMEPAAAGSERTTEDAKRVDNNRKIRLIVAIGVYAGICLVALGPPVIPVFKLVAVLLMFCCGGLATMQVVAYSLTGFVDWCCPPRADSNGKGTLAIEL